MLISIIFNKAAKCNPKKSKVYFQSFFKILVENPFLDSFSVIYSKNCLIISDDKNIEPILLEPIGYSMSNVTHLAIFKQVIDQSDSETKIYRE